MYGAAAGFHGLPLGEKLGDGGGLHAVHGLEFSGFLAVEQLPMFVEDGEGGDAFAKGYLVTLGDGGVLVYVSDVDVDEDEVRFEDGAILWRVKVHVEDLAIPAPVAAEVEEEALMGCGCGFESGSEVGLGLCRGGVDFAGGLGGAEYRESEYYHQSQKVDYFRG